MSITTIIKILYQYFVPVISKPVNKNHGVEEKNEGVIVEKVKVC